MKVARSSDMNILDKYKKYDNSKRQQSQQQHESLDRIEFYNPGKHIDSTGKTYTNEKGKTVKRAIVRVLPNNRKGEFFFYEYMKHRVKIGAVTKTALCLHTINPETGDRFSDSCPFCDFISENRNHAPEHAIKAMLPKEAQVMLVYVYSSDSVQKYETNYYGNIKLMPKVIKLIEDGVDIESEGFDLIFEKEGNGWPEVYDVRAPKYSLEDIFKKSKVLKEIPDTWKLLVHEITDKYKETIYSTFSYCINALCPSFSDEYSSVPIGDAVVDHKKDDDVDDFSDVTFSSSYTYDPNDDDSDAVSPVDDADLGIGVVSANDAIIKKQEENSTSDIDDMEDLTDIQEFVEKFKKMNQS